MNTRTRLFAGFGLLVLLLAALGAFTIYRLMSIASLAEKLHQHPFAVAKSAQDFRADVRAMHRSMKDVVLGRVTCTIGDSGQRVLWEAGSS